MKAFNTYGCKCNGCGHYAEFCSCDIDSSGNIVKKSNDYSRNGRVKERDEEEEV
jgi:hypothetical protein